MIISTVLSAQDFIEAVQKHDARMGNEGEHSALLARIVAFKELERHNMLLSQASMEFCNIVNRHIAYGETPLSITSSLKDFYDRNEPERAFVESTLMSGRLDTITISCEDMFSQQKTSIPKSIDNPPFTERSEYTPTEVSDTQSSIVSTARSDIDDVLRVVSDEVPEAVVSEYVGVGKITPTRQKQRTEDMGEIPFGEIQRTNVFQIVEATREHDRIFSEAQIASENFKDAAKAHDSNHESAELLQYRVEAFRQFRRYANDVAKYNIRIQRYLREGNASIPESVFNAVEAYYEKKAESFQSICKTIEDGLKDGHSSGCDDEESALTYRILQNLQNRDDVGDHSHGSLNSLSEWSILTDNCVSAEDKESREKQGIIQLNSIVQKFDLSIVAAGLALKVFSAAVENYEKSVLDGVDCEDRQLLLARIKAYLDLEKGVHFMRIMDTSFQNTLALQVSEGLTLPQSVVEAMRIFYSRRIIERDVIEQAFEDARGDGVSEKYRNILEEKVPSLPSTARSFFSDDDNSYSDGSSYTARTGSEFTDYDSAISTARTVSSECNGDTSTHNPTESRTTSVKEFGVSNNSLSECIVDSNLYVNQRKKEIDELNIAAKTYGMLVSTAMKGAKEYQQAANYSPEQNSNPEELMKSLMIRAQYFTTLEKDVSEMHLGKHFFIDQLKHHKDAPEPILLALKLFYDKKLEEVNHVDMIFSTARVDEVTIAAVRDYNDPDKMKFLASDVFKLEVGNIPRLHLHEDCCESNSSYSSSSYTSRSVTDASSRSYTQSDCN